MSTRYCQMTTLNVEVLVKAGISLSEYRKALEVCKKGMGHLLKQIAEN